MKMIGYLGGDANTLVSRKARENDLRVAIEFEDENRMLVLMVAQTGEVMLAWTEIQPESKPDQLHLIGTIDKQGEEKDGVMYFQFNEVHHPPEPLAPVHFLHAVEDLEDE